MSQLSGNPTDRYRALSAPAVGTGQIEGSLQTPGLETPPPVSATANELQQLNQTIGAAGQVGEQLARRQEHINDQAKEADIGHGDLTGRTIRQNIQNQLANGTQNFEVPVDPDKIPELAQQIADSYIPPNASEAFKKGYYRDTVPGLVEDIGKIQQQKKAESIKYVWDFQSQAAISARSPDELAQIESAARAVNPKATTAQIDNNIFKDAMESAALNGDAQRVKMYQDYLGPDRLAPEQARANIQLLGAKERQQRASQELFDNSLGLMNLNGESFDARRSFVREAQQNGIITPEYASQKDSQLAGQEREYNNQTIAAQTKLLRDQYKQQDINDTITHLFNYQTTGGAATVPDTKKPLPNDTEFKYDNKAKVADALDAVFSQMDQLHPDPTAITPELQNLDQKLSIIVKTGAPWEAVSNLLNGGVNQSDIQAIAATASDGKTPQMSAALSQGIDVWDKMAVNPVARKRLASKETEMFYETVDLARKYATGGDKAKAALLASQAISDRDAFSERLSDRIPLTDLNKAIKDVSTKTDDPYTPTWLGGSSALGEFKNQNMVARDVENLTRFAMSKALNLPPKAALEWASDTVRHSLISVDGWAVDAANRAIPGDLSATSKSLAQKYVAANPNEGLSADDLKLHPLTTNSWVIVNGHTNMPVDNWQSQGVFTDAELSKMYVDRQVAAAVHPAGGPRPPLPDVPENLLKYTTPRPGGRSAY